MFADLHMHSCLSPCADDDMTPANICGMAYIKGLQAIAVTDHNTGRNLPYVKEAADHYKTGTSIPMAFVTSGRKMPDPPSSNQPNLGCLMWTSMLGSVKGK